MRVMLTGGAGYIGSLLTEKLLQDGHEVTVIDNFMYKQHSLLNLCSDPKLTVIKGDIRRKELLKQHVHKYDVIIPLAAIVGMPACNNNPELAYQINTQQITDILSLRSHDQMLLFPNTNSGYGQGEGAVFTEESELNPISVYGKTKCESEKRVRDEQNTVVFRLATVFGSSPKMRLDLLVNDFTYRAWWDGYITLFESHFKRNYVHVKDVSNLFAWSIKNWNDVKDDVFNFGLSEANLSKRELCEKIQIYLPSFYINEHENKKDPDQRNYIVLNDKIESRGFKASYSIDQGIQELLKTFQIIQPQIYSNII